MFKPDFFCSAHCKKVEIFSNKAQDIQQPIGRHLLMYYFPNKVKPGKQKSSGYKGYKRNALEISFLPSCVDFPNFGIFSITSSNLEYEMEHRLGSIKSFTLSPK